jgi:hypothetical protein
MLAVVGDDRESASALVAAGADPDAKDARGDAPRLETGASGSVGMRPGRIRAPAGADYDWR